MSDDSVFDNFPKISDHIPKIFQNCSKGQTNVTENFRRFPKIAEDFQEDLKMFRSNTNEFKYNLRDKLDISKVIDIFTSKDMEICHSNPGCSFV